MDYATYQQRVLTRASHRWHNENVSFEAFAAIIEDFIEAGNQLDKLKKALMYGRELGINPYGNLGLDPTDSITQLPSQEELGEPVCRLFHACIGLATEGVEMMEHMRDLFNGAELDAVNMQEEFGDAEWYRAFGLATLGQTHEANLAQNDAKLEARFGPAFSEEAANNRDLATERNILEGGKPGGPGFEDLRDGN